MARGNGSDGLLWKSVARRLALRPTRRAPGCEGGARQTALSGTPTPINSELSCRPRAGYRFGGHRRSRIGSRAAYRSLEDVVAIVRCRGKTPGKQTACGSAHSRDDRKPGQVAPSFWALPSPPRCASHPRIEGRSDWLVISRHCTILWVAAVSFFVACTEGHEARCHWLLRSYASASSGARWLQA